MKDRGNRQKRNAERKERRRVFLREVNEQLKEHRRSFVVYSVLRILVIVTMVRQFMLGNFESFMLCILTLILLFLPSVIEVRFRVALPQSLQIIIYCFIYAAEILGEVNSYYTAIPIWDTMLHTLNGFLAAAVGFSMVMLLDKNDRIIFDLDPGFLALVAFCFSMTIGVIWEFFEFSMDHLFLFDMQKDTVIPVISSVMLNDQGRQAPVIIRGIREVAVNGQILPVKGYLDVGLIDTMKDLFVNFIGALVFSVFGYIALKTKRGDFGVMSRFIVIKQDTTSDIKGYFGASGDEPPKEESDLKKRE